VTKTSSTGTPFNTICRETGKGSLSIVPPRIVLVVTEPTNCPMSVIRDRPKTDFTFSAENEKGPKMKFHFRPETETKTKTAMSFRPKTKTKTKLSSSRNNMRQSNVLLCEYANDAAQIQNYKNSRY